MEKKGAKMRHLLVIIVGTFVLADVLAIQSVGMAAERSIQPIGHLSPAEFQAYLDQHDPLWDQAPRAWEESAFIGNGMMGTTVWVGHGESLHWDLGRTDVYDTGKHRTRMPIGKLSLKLKGETTQFAMRQSLGRAEVTGTVKTSQGGVSWRSIIPHEKMVGLIEYVVSGKERPQFTFCQTPAVPTNVLRKHLRKKVDAKMAADEAFKKSAAVHTRLVTDFFDPKLAGFIEELSSDKDLFKNPEPSSGETDAINWLLQPFSSGGGYVVAWQIKEDVSGKGVLAYSIDYFDQGTPTVDQAVQIVSQAVQIGYNSISEKHQQWWRDYYSKSFISLPHFAMENYYWMQIYKMGSATRRDGVVLDEIGPWHSPTEWARVWNNINIQIAYHSMMTANHLELCEPFIRLFDSMHDNLRNAVPAKWNSNGAMALGRTMDLKGRMGWSREFGNLSWALHDYWMYCRYTGDDELMKTGLLPLLKGSVNFMLNALEIDSQGRYHLPPDISPEYSDKAFADTNYNLGLLRWSLQTLTHLNSQFHLNDPDLDRWQDVLTNLVSFPTNENGLMIGSEVPLDQSHRHYSHLLPFFPLAVIDPESAEGHELFKTSYNHWDRLEPKQWNLFSYYGAASMAAWLRDGDEAVKQLEGGFSKMAPNTFFGRIPAIESAMAGTIAIGEMLLQSWTHTPGDFRLRIFPAIPESWQEVCFRHLRAEGGFLVSAAKRDGNIQFVEITSLAGNPCHLELPFSGPFIITSGGGGASQGADQNGRQVLSLEIPKGETIQLISKSTHEHDVSLRIYPVSHQVKDR